MADPVRIVGGGDNEGIQAQVDKTSDALRTSLYDTSGNTISINDDGQLNVTPFHADGTEGVLISGIKKESGKDGIDSSTNTLQIIDYVHHEIHGGSGWDITDKTNLPADDFLDIRITTAAGTKYAHLTIEYHSEDETECWLYEGVTLTMAHGSATALTPRNHRRPSGDSGTIITASYVVNTTLANANSDTGIGDAIEIAHCQQGAGRNSPTSGSSREEWILAADTNYSLRFEDIGGSAGYISWHLDWYEHTDKN